MLTDDLGRFDYVLAMDSLIYYGTADIAAAIGTARPPAPTRRIVFTVAAQDRASDGHAGPWASCSRAATARPLMVPQDHRALTRATAGRIAQVDRVSRGFYISECLEHRA